VRIALNAIGEVGVRTGRILTAERDLVALGLYGDTTSIGQDRRTIAISSLGGFDLLVTDDVEEGSALARIAADDGVSCALPGDVTPEVAARFEESGTSVLITHCSIEGLAETLAAHEAARADDVAETVIAWTEEGKPLRSGEPVGFPDPVGARWGKRRRSAGTTTRIAVPVDSDWAGATATVVGRIGRGRETRIVGVADQARHLEALALAAGAVAAVRTDLTGVIAPKDVAEDFLSIALAMGLGVAAYTMD
jgi:hypothetical protein